MRVYDRVRGIARGKLARGALDDLPLGLVRVERQAERTLVGGLNVVAQQSPELCAGVVRRRKVRLERNGGIERGERLVQVAPAERRAETPEGGSVRLGRG